MKNISLDRVRFSTWNWLCTAVLFTFMMLRQYTQLFPVAIKIFHFTAARQCYDLQNILSSWTWEFHLTEFVLLTQIPLWYKAISSLWCRRQSFFGYWSEAAKQSAKSKWLPHTFPSSLAKPTRHLWITLFFTEYRAVGRKTQTTCTPWKENRALHVSHGALQRQDERKRNKPCLTDVNETQRLILMKHWKVASLL